MMSHYHVALLGLCGNRRIAEDVLGLQKRRSGSPFQLYWEFRSLLGSERPMVQGSDVTIAQESAAVAAALSPEYGS